MFKASRVLNPDYPSDKLSELKQIITNNFMVDEDAYMQELLSLANPGDQDLQDITGKTIQLINKVRSRDDAVFLVDALLQQYSLNTDEGIVLMCLAEALLRIPDAKTANQLIKDKLNSANWKSHLNQSGSFLVNASAWGLLITGRFTSLDTKKDGEPSNIINRMIKRMGEPLIRQAMMQAMKIMAKQFVLGRNIEEALDASQENREKGYSHSYDMLGEAALTMEDAYRYYDDYSKSIAAVGKVKLVNPDIPKPSISIKLSALHPRYEASQRQRILQELANSIEKLTSLARDLGVDLSIDAEEVDRMELSLELFEKVYTSASCKGWGGLEFVVQAYSKRALPTLCWLKSLAKQQGDIIPVRLVKGAYWDSEIKLSQQSGLDAYPLFTRKSATDVSYLACARYLLSDQTEGLIYPQFATHNAHTVTNILQLAGSRPFEFQRLHGMGKALYDTVMENHSCHCRIYAPVGAHKDLLPYLVRRLLENGANTSFVHRLVDAKTPVEELAHHPVNILKSYPCISNEKIPLPPALYGTERRNSQGLNMNINQQYNALMPEIKKFTNTTYDICSIINGEQIKTDQIKNITCPYDKENIIGKSYQVNEPAIEKALSTAYEYKDQWDATSVEVRAACLDRTADLLELHRPELMALCARESGKVIQDGIDEIREAVDFCRYYAARGRELFSKGIKLPGPTGEHNELYLQGRGPFLCISPWNFPLAIFMGQVAAALVAGNPVLAKPADQSSIIAFRAVQLLLEAGIPQEALQLLIGKGSRIGGQLTTDARIAGVVFTGSTSVAQLINRNLAARDAAISPLIAETGGQNVMVVDSSALPEQVVEDVIHSAFTSAGQRCSALRVLFLQEEIAPRVIEILTGAMKELNIGDPDNYATDVGPVIDGRARQELLDHIENMKNEAIFIAQTELPEWTDKGHFVPPTAFELHSISQLKEENFGPVLHIIRYKSSELSEIIDSINKAGYGLTLGIHSRNENVAINIEKKVRVGNSYINRNMIGATVGVQPFGGQGLSGTGPKAGGPHYLLRFATERTRTINTAALGGNADLLSLDDK